MAIQQMALLAYRAPPAGGGGDSAYLPNPLSLSDAINPITIKFYDTGIFQTSSQFVVSYTASNQYTWKTGPNAANAYEVNFIFVDGTAEFISGDALSTWHQLGTAQFPSWSLANGIGSTLNGYLVIRAIANPSVELANSTVSLTADPNA